jgi:hypothetical protein
VTERKHFLGGAVRTAGNPQLEGLAPLGISRGGEAQRVSVVRRFIDVFAKKFLVQPVGWPGESDGKVASPTGNS